MRSGAGRRRVLTVSPGAPGLVGVGVGVAPTAYVSHAREAEEGRILPPRACVYVSVCLSVVPLGGSPAARRMGRATHPRSGILLNPFP